MRFNDTLHTVLAAKSLGRNGAVTRWRQCVDLLAQFDRAEGTELSDADRDALLSELTALRGQIDERQRMSTVIDLGSRLRSPVLIKFFAADRPSICAAAMTRAQLGDSLWPEIMGDLSPIGRGVLRNRTDMGPLARRALASFGPHDLVLTSSAAPEKTEAAAVSQMEPEPATVPDPSGSQIQHLVERIESFQSSRATHPSTIEPQALASPELGTTADQGDVREFSFETNIEGVIHWVKGASRGQLIGLSISEPPPFANAGPDGHVAGAFRHRTAFRNARFTIETGSLAGEWRMSAIPYFNQQTGRFQGYRGNARRPHLHEMTATAGWRDGLYGSDRQRESLRELIHELRTPLNAILGFAEIIDHQFFGPVGVRYREIAQDIVADAQKLLGTFDDLDLASRIERGDFEARPGVVDPAELLHGLAARFRENGAAAQLDMAASDGLPPLGLDRLQAERMFQHLLRIVLSVAEAGEHIQGRCWSDVGPSGGTIIFAIDRPAALQSMDEAEIFDPGYGPDGEGPDAPLLGIGFSLRLVRNLARGGGGDFYIEEDRFTLVLPARIQAEESEVGG